jgi:glucose-1-phosphate thymidylyltransferase
MRGVILAGGTGSRLMPLTKAVNKHLLPIYDKPMIHYPINSLIDSGIRDILIVCGRGHEGAFMEYLGSGAEYGVRLEYAVQEKPQGIADALILAEDYAQNGDVAVILGDNIFERPIDTSGFHGGARIFLKRVSGPERFGIAELQGKRIVSIAEKPIKPKTNYAVTGAYIYDNTVFEKVRRLDFSRRRELEITDVNNAYILEGRMDFAFVEGYWVDAGTFEALLEANRHFGKNRQHL